MEQKVSKILDTIIHPGSGKSLTETGVSFRMIEGGSGQIGIVFPRKTDPFKKSLLKKIEASLKELNENSTVCELTMNEPAPYDPLQGIKKVIAVASGKGGVGKSSVASNLAVAFAKAGYRTGLLDADLYGPSQPVMFNLEEYVPAMESRHGIELMVPALAHDVKIMSIGFFVNTGEAVIWRGPMATSAIKQMIGQTDWGDLDFLVIDLPPGTGDIHLTVAATLEIDGAVIVTTPQKIATADVVRGVNMFRSEGMEIPVLGVIENMSWFSPPSREDERYYLFGKDGGKELAEEMDIELLAQIPIKEGIMQGAENGVPVLVSDPMLSKNYQQLVDKIVRKLNNNS